MKKKYLFILLSILLTFSICLPVNSYANALELNYISSFSNDKLLCDGAPAPIGEIFGNFTTGEIIGTGQSGADITVVLTIDGVKYTYKTKVGADGNWSTTANPPPKPGSDIYVTQVDLMGNTTIFDGYWL